jgi:hypothetical protein
MLTHCGGPGPETNIRHPRRPVSTTAVRPLPGLPAFVVAQVPSGTQGPVVTSRNESSLAVWAETTSAGVWQFRSAAIQSPGGKVSAAVQLGQAPENLELIFLRYLKEAGALLAYTHADNNGGHRFSAMLLDEKGRAQSEPVLLGVSSEALLWIEVVPTSSGPLVIWASSRGDRADVRAAALNPKGVVRAAARDVASDLRAWQVTPTAQGAALATVRAVSNKVNGPVNLTFLDDSGAVSGPVVTVTQSETAELDLDVVTIGGNCIVAWTDRLKGDARLYTAAVDASGKIVTPAHPVTPPLGDQSLVKLVTPRGAASGYLVWEDILAPVSVRRLQVAPIDENAQLGQQHRSIAYPESADHPPEIVASEQGLSFITQIPTATLQSLAAPHQFDPTFDGQRAPFVPVFVSMSEKMEVTGVAPLLLDSRPTVPSLVWGLHCHNYGCFMLAALSGDPSAAVLGVDVARDVRASRSFLDNGKTNPPKNVSGSDSSDSNLRAWLVQPAETVKKPRLSAVRVLAESEPLADLAVTIARDVPLVSTLTYFDAAAPIVAQRTPAEDGRRDPLQARIDVRGPLGESTSSQGFVSLRARSAGGLSWAVSPDAKDRLLAWSALDQRQPQVFVTEFDESGKKRLQRMITHGKGNIVDVAAAATPLGFFVGWIDDSAPNAQAYVARLNRSLDRQGPEQPVSNMSSAKTGLELLTTGNELWAVWSDTRESTQNRADIFLRRFAVADGHPLGAEQRLFETPAHSHSPTLSLTDSGVVIAWMESEPRGDSPEGIANVRIAKLDEQGRSGNMRSVQVSKGIATAFGLNCLNKECHLVVSVDIGGVGQIEGARVDPHADGPIQTAPLIRSLGPADESVSPVVAGNDAYWVDRSTTKTVRVMRAAIEW